MKVAGIYPQTTDASNIIARSTYGEPTGLGKILAIAKEAGCDVLYEMPIGESLNEMLQRVEQFDPDLVFLSLMTCQVPVGIEVAKLLKETRPSRLVIAGGYHPSASQNVLDPFDAYVMGEGEIPAHRIISAMIQGEDWKNSPGLLLPDGRKNECVDRVRNLEKFPWALRNKKILKQTYFGLTYPPSSQQVGFAFVEYGRGCKWHCKFCCKDVIWNNGLVYRDPDDVVDEMMFLQKQNEVNLFAFTDLNFTSSSEKVFALCQSMKKKCFNGNWLCMSNVATASQPVLKAISEVGCVKVMYGVESINEETVSKIGKDFVLEKDSEVLENTMSLNMLSHAFYIVGFPWETQKGIESSLSLLCKLPALQIRIGIATPLPGSSWHNEFTMGLSDDLAAYDCENLVYEHSDFKNDKLQDMIHNAYATFYQSENYDRRVRRFLSGNTKYEDAFLEFFGLLDNLGYGPVCHDLFERRLSCD